MCAEVVCIGESDIFFVYRECVCIICAIKKSCMECNVLYDMRFGNIRFFEWFAGEFVLRMHCILYRKRINSRGILMRSSGSDFDPCVRLSFRGYRIHNMHRSDNFRSRNQYLYFL